MTEKLENQPPNPYDTASYASRGIFFWMIPFIVRGFKRTLSLKDIYVAPKNDLSKDLGSQLDQEWKTELRIARESSFEKQPSLLRAISKAFGTWYLIVSIIELLSECIARPLQAIALGQLISDVNLYMLTSESETAIGSTTPSDYLNSIYWRVFYDGLFLIAMSFLSIVTMHPFVFACQHVGMKIRIACCQLIYRHSLKLSNVAIGQTTAGQLVNLLSNDVNRFDIALNYLPYLVIAPIQALVTFVILSSLFFGFYATLAGSLLLLLYVPFQTLMGRYFGKLRQQTAVKTDERIRLMNEIIPAMRVIKMYTWELPFARLVELARRREVDKIRHTSILRSINMALFFVSSKIILFIILITYTLLGYTLSPETVFVGITLLHSVRLFMTLFFPYGVAQLAETLISLQRLQTFLLLPTQRSSALVDRRPVVYDSTDSSDDDTDGNNETKENRSLRIKFSDVSANWLLSNTNEALSLPEQPKGELLSTVKTTTNSKRDIDMLSSRSSLLDVSSSSAPVKQDLQKQVRTTSQLSKSTPSEIAVCALRGITFEIRAGELLVVAGRVGSGKSSIMLAMLGELPLAAGRMTICGIVSYAPQNAWIFAGSVRDNVLFGKQMDEQRYNEVLRVCSLDKDIALLPNGDETIVGERGVSLSGGQRARVNLARAIYYDADVYLLDDPLSAVDTVVAKHIFNECVCGYLKNKAVVLATHQTQFVQKNTKVLYLDSGRQVSCKKLSDNSELLAFVSSNFEKSDSDTAQSKITRPIQEAINSSSSSKSKSKQKEITIEDDNEDTLLISATQLTNDEIVEASKINGEQHLTATDESTHQNKTTAESVNSSGDDSSVSRGIYWYYVRACNSFWLILICMLSNLGTQTLFNGTDFWLSLWTDTEQRRANAIEEAVPFVKQTLTDKLTMHQNTAIYTGLVIALFVLSLIRTSCFFIACTRASICLHDRLFRSVLCAPIKFFDYNPIGVLLNRVSRDMGIVDELLPPTAFDTVEIFINVIGILITVAIVYPISIGPAIVLCTVVTIIRLLYMRTVRSVKTLEGVTRSPVYTHLATSLNGLATIRAFGMEPEFEKRFDEYQDVHTSTWFLFVSSSRWLCSTLDWLSNTYIAVITLTMTLTVGSATGSEIGLAISSALALSGSFQWGIRQSTEMESYMTSVSRIKEYCELPREEDEDENETMSNNDNNNKKKNINSNEYVNIDSNDDVNDNQQQQLAISSSNFRLQMPPPNWPTAGCVEFIDVKLRYFENDEPVLRGLSFEVRAREKIGIVGRTGAGKSSIIAALFRLTEPTGCIKIDGVDISTLKLHELRRKISIIPQEPILFSGTIRRNLDPFDEYDDTAIWSALDSVQLRDVLLTDDFETFAPGNNKSSTLTQKQSQSSVLQPTPVRKSTQSSSFSAAGLETPVREGGANFSVGQRQLICLARAILRRNKILVLDEATANVDPQTDKFIQRTIRRLFASCTVITIAHRLNTIMDCERVLVLDAGKLCEYDEPHLLLQRRDGLFAAMAANTGQQANKLRRIAEHAYNKRRAGQSSASTTQQQQAAKTQD